MESGTQHDDARLEQARVDTLYRFAKPAYATTLAIAVLLAVMLWGPLTAATLQAWLLAVLATTLARVVLHWRYARAGGAARAPALWERRFSLGALAGGALWAAAALVFFPVGDPLMQTVLVFIVVGSGLGAIGVYGASVPAFFAFVALPLGTVILLLASQPGRSYQLLAMMVLVFAAVASWVYRGIHANFIGMLRTRLRNEALSARLAASEARLRDAIESFPEGIAVYDDSDHLVLCNDAYARTYGDGRASGQLAGVPYRDIARTAYAIEMPGSPADAFESWFDECTARHRLPGGSSRVFQVGDGRWLQGRFEHTHAGGSVSMFTDISELKRAQDAYLALFAEENLMLDTLPVGVAFLRDRIIERCNPLLERMLGYAPGELAGRSVRDIYFTDAYWRQGVDFYDKLGSGGVFEIDGPLRRKDGSRAWLHMQMRAANPAAPRESAILAFMDIAERREAEARLKRSEAMYRNLVETSNDLIWASDADGNWSYLNAAASRRIYGFEPAELLGRPMSERLAPEVIDRDIAVFDRVLAGESVHDYETRHLRRDGTHVDLSFNAIPLRDMRGNTVGTTGTARDITDQRLVAVALHESVEKLRLAADAADLYYWEWDVDADVVLWGRNPSGLIGVADEPSTTTWPELRALVHPEDRERYDAAGRRAIESGDGYRCEFRIVTPAGETRWLASEGKLMRDRDGASRRMLGASRDVTQAKRQEEEVRFLAYHDMLTGLPNRRLLDDRLKQAVYLAQRRDSRVGVMLVDLDDFKQVNDTLGHRAGDAVLREVARRLGGCVRKADTVARQGGDEFVVVMPDLALEVDCQVVAEKILRALEPPCMVDGRELRIGASIGISVFPADAGDGEALLRNADVAMYRAKQLGRNNYRFYSR